jgi:hypothetical protein
LDSLRSFRLQFKRFSTVDNFKRHITYYVATPRDSGGPLPLAVFVQDSGCDSQFWSNDGTVTGRVQDLLTQAAHGRLRVVVVEKPGVKYLDQSRQMGTAEGCSEEFLREHTLPRWAEAVAAAVRAAAKSDTRKLLVIGWSEGAIVQSMGAIVLQTSEGARPGFMLLAGT